MTGDVLRTLADQATPGPWVPGSVWGTAGEMAELYGEGKCAFCKQSDPVRVGVEDINGTRMMAHLHRFEAYDKTHDISGADGAKVAGNYDYEEGGIINAADTALICALGPDAARLLADMADALQDTPVPKRSIRHEDSCSCPRCEWFPRVAALLVRWGALGEDTT